MWVLKNGYSEWGHEFLKGYSLLAGLKFHRLLH